MTEDECPACHIRPDAVADVIAERVLAQQRITELEEQLDREREGRETQPAAP